MPTAPITIFRKKLESGFCASLGIVSWSRTVLVKLQGLLRRKMLRQISASVKCTNAGIPETRLSVKVRRLIARRSRAHAPRFSNIRNASVTAFRNSRIKVQFTATSARHLSPSSCHRAPARRKCCIRFAIRVIQHPQEDVPISA